MVIWLGNSRYIHRPLIYFYILYSAGWFLYHHDLNGKNGERRLIYTFLFWMGIVDGGAIWLSALAITNTTISVTGSYLMTALISSILLMSESFSKESTDPDKTGLRLGSLTAILLVGTTLFAKGFLVCSNEGAKDTVAMVRPKALYGPAKGIYCRYMEGYALNTYAELLEQASIRNQRVLYVGCHSLIYLYGDQVICNYSTISTPTYDERLKDYWQRNPEKWPEFVICDTSEAQLTEIRQIIPLGELITECVISDNGSSIRIYSVAE